MDNQQSTQEKAVFYPANFIVMNKRTISIPQKSLRSVTRHSEAKVPKVPQQMKLTLKKQKLSQSTGNMLNLYTKTQKFIPNRDCLICLSPMLKGFRIADCDHIFCEDCLVHYLTQKIDSMQEIICPSKGCNKKLDENCQVYLKLPQKYKQKHKRQQLWSKTMNNSDLKMMKEHSQKPCDENFKQNFKWKRCPKCRTLIKKSEECNHMTCQCGHQFCFICLENFSPFHRNCSLLVSEKIQNQDHNQCIGFLMIILLPLVLLIGIVVSIILMVVGFLLGPFLLIGYLLLNVEQFQDRRQSNGDQLAPVIRCFIIIFIPVIGIIGPFVVLVYVTKSLIITNFTSYWGQYIRAIRSHCS